MSKLNALVLMTVFLSFQANANTDQCAPEAGEPHKVNVRYIGDASVTRNGHTAHLAKYEISNNSPTTFTLAAYRDSQPKRAYPVDAMLEYQDADGAWTYDVVVLDHPAPPTSKIKVKSGQVGYFLASGYGGPNGTYRLKIREPDNDCWVVSAPFKFKP